MGMRFEVRTATGEFLGRVNANDINHALERAEMKYPVMANMGLNVTKDTRGNTRKVRNTDLSQAVRIFKEFVNAWYIVTRERRAEKRAKEMTPNENVFSIQQ